MWYEQNGEISDVILSSKIRILRNIKGFSFPKKMSPEEKENVIGMVRQALSSHSLSFVRADELDDENKKTLFENWTISKGFTNDGKGKGLLTNADGSQTVIINDVDHISVQTFSAGGVDIDKSYISAEALTVDIEKAMDVAYSEKMGFLTSHINDAGSGMRIGYLVAIPGITKAGMLLPFIKKIAKYDWTLIPAFQTRQTKDDFLFILTNTTTLGIDEKKLLEGARSISRELVKAERACRTEIYKKNTAIVEDQFYRSYAILKYGRRISSAESTGLISWLWMCQDKFKDSAEAKLNWGTIRKLTVALCCNLITRSPLPMQRNAVAIEKESRLRADKARKILEGVDSI